MILSFQTVMPALFVILWSTGFIGAKLGLPYAPPFTFLSIRMALVVAILTIAALAFRAPWPKSPRLWLHLAVSGLLVHGLYLGGVFAAIKVGLSSGLTALLVGLQPLLTALLAGPLLGERIHPRQWLGLALGLLGVGLVLLGADKDISADSLSWPGLAFAAIALAGITAGTLYQKRFGTNMDLRSGSAIQFMGASLLLMPLALATESQPVHWNPTFLFALSWLVLVLSIGAISLLMLLIKTGEASKVASLFYLTPAVTAAMAWALFDEKLGLIALGGMALTAIGVALVVRKA